MTERQNVKVSIRSKSIFGSITDDHKYGNDTVISVIEWLQQLLNEIPEEYRATAEIEIESVGGYEGEHHSEIEVYYKRPETDAEMSTRLAKMRAMATGDLQRHEAYARQAADRLRALGQRKKGECNG